MDKQNITTFRTLKKHNVVIIEQPSYWIEKYTSGAKSGQVKSRRQIQYCEHLDTIFIDEQIKLDPNPKVTPIYISKGTLSIPEIDYKKVEFMEKSHQNEANGGSLFKLLDIEKEEEFEIAAFEANDKAKFALSTADDNLVRTLAVWFFGVNYLHKSVNSLKIMLRRAIDLNQKLADGKTQFVDSFNDFVTDKNNDEKLMVSLCLSKEIIRIAEGRKIVWNDSGEVIYIGSQAKEIVREFSTWVKNDEEGRTIYKVLVEQIEKLK